MSGELLMAFWGVSFLLVMTPGMDWAYVISAGCSGRGVVPAVSGLLSGHLLATLLVVAGAGALVSRYPLALSGLTLAGAGYLLWLGVSMVRHSLLASTPLSIPTLASPHDSWLHWLVRGACVSGMNPKVFLLFLALLPQFTDPHGDWSLPEQMLTLGGLHLLSCGIVYLTVGYGAKRLLRSRPQANRWLRCGSGVAMLVIGSGLLIEQWL
ncbi:MAG: LysE family translocator [Aeromonadaceae bacterium]